MPLFLNISNHPSAAWSCVQLDAAHEYGEVRDILFPVVDPQANRGEIISLAEDLASEALALKPIAVLCQGEFTLCFAIVKRLQAAGITVLAACSERVSVEQQNSDGSLERRSVFRFVQFREYDNF